jgi:hypothetical protein
MPWQFGFDYHAMGYGNPQPLGDERLQLRKLLRAQNTTEWINISTEQVMEVVFYPHFGILDLNNGVFHGLGNWENRVMATMLNDIGKITVEIFVCEAGVSE